MKKLSQKRQRQIIQNIGEETCQFVEFVLESLDEIRRANDCNDFNILHHENGAVEIEQDDTYIVLRTKKDVQRLVNELSKILE